MFSRTVVSVLAAALSCSAVPLSDFTAWSQKFGKTYAQDEAVMRQQVFNSNLQLINAHNAREAAGLETWTMGVNQFTDMTPAEFKKQISNPFKRSSPRNETWLQAAAPLDDVDWRTKGAVTPVKNQGQCGSCWSFSTTGSTEGAWQIAGHPLVSLSEQQLMDCSTAEGDHSCQGGLMDYAFKYIIQNKGLDTEMDYPYKMANEACQTAKEANHAATITSYTDVPANSDMQLAAAVAKGPVSVAIEADQAGFQHYASGVFSGPCGVKLDHGVLAVGYTANAWIVKNSWGATWGDAGYIQLARNTGVSGTCGILLQPSYPISGTGPSPPGPAPPGPPMPPTPGQCSSVAPGARVDCGFGLGKQACTAKNCCYDDSTPGTFDCFNPGAKDVCSSIDPGKRVDCGYTDDKPTCEAAGCCFDDTKPNTYKCFCKSVGPSPPGPTPPGPTPPGPPPPGPPPSGSHYGDPAKGPCLPDEKAVTINGISGSYCAPHCSASAPCPAVPAGTTAAAQCVVSDPSPPPSLCAVICVPGMEWLKSGDGGCMPGASCQAIQGTGVCTYPAAGNAQTFAFNLKIADVQTAEE